MGKFGVLAILVGFALSNVELVAARAETLITTEEAKQPGPMDAPLDKRGLTRGPGIELESPAPGQSVTSPLPFKIKFHARNKVPIDLKSVKLIYLKATPIDLTERIKNHITAGGIIIEEAEVPAGLHMLRLNLTDDQGRVSTLIIKLMVTGK